MTSPTDTSSPTPRWYYRLHFLWRLLGCRGIRWLAWAGFVLWLIFAFLVLLLRYVVLPHVSEFRPEIEKQISVQLGQPVRIQQLDARWQGLNPDLVMQGVEILDRQGQVGLLLPRVDAVLSWKSVLQARVVLALLALDRPELYVRRSADGQFSVAGIESSDNQEGGGADWILSQDKIRVFNASVVWEDQLRHAPPLPLHALNFGLDNHGQRHRFGFSAQPPGELANRIDLRGEVRGNLDEDYSTWVGRLFVELDYADLAGWRAWVDYPFPLEQGRGAVRLWGDLKAGEGRVTTDLALQDIRTQLGEGLPFLELVSLKGRLEGNYAANAWGIKAKKIELLTRDGLQVAPTDFQLEWQRGEGQSATGRASATSLDVGILSHLATYLPLDENSRDLLRRHQPKGKVSALNVSWTQKDSSLARYAVRANFNQLALLPGGAIPGAEGISGSIEANEQGGSLLLENKTSMLSLPAVFPEPDIQLDELKVRAAWHIGKLGELEIHLERVDFSGPDAAAKVKGTYRRSDEGPGVIDLTADISRGEGTAVWRYMPHAVNADARAWLRRGIVGGRGYDGKLVLKGDLRHFPFRDPSTGTFYVTAKAADAKIDYADGWPVIEHINADMRFGIGMHISAHAGQILGARLPAVKVDIPDFDSHEEMLLVRGQAEGPTASFLEFIEKSPVSAKIDRFTEGMKATGKGRLELELDLPLRHIDTSAIRGSYFFHNDQLQPVSALPPISQVNGKLAFTERSVKVDEITGKLFGGVAKVQVKNEGEKLTVSAAGQASLPNVFAHFGWPTLGQLSGSAPWRANVNVRKRQVDISVDSSLQGVSSSLPEPFNKSTNATLPFRLDISPQDATRTQYRVTLGKQLKALLIQRDSGNKTDWEKGIVVIGEGDLRLPERALSVYVGLPQVDGDAWRKLYASLGANGKATSDSTDIRQGTGLALGQIRLKTPRLRLLDREQHQVDVTLRPKEADWLLSLNMSEIQGDLLWRTAGEGAIEGKLKRLVLNAPTNTGATANAGASDSSLLDSLPAMNVSVDELVLGEKALGQLDLKARNESGTWWLDLLSLKSPEGMLKGKGSWIRGTKQQTKLEFEANSQDLGKWLVKMGYGDALSRGVAKVSGDVAWDGGVTNVNYPSLSGHLVLRVEKGQFNKIEPGLGKLLGLLSLQALPRRLTLDFKDIFSDGLAFDHIDGKFLIRKGLLKTQDPLMIRAPAAQVEMQGEADLKNETQDVYVLVKPELSTATAFGVMTLVNPVAGAATLLAGAVGKNPLNSLFSYRYHVTGTWADPVVSKVSGSVPKEENKAEDKTETKADEAKPALQEKE